MCVCTYIGTTHSATEAEKIAFVDWINHSLGHDSDLQKLGHIPMKDVDDMLYSSCHDGVLIAYVYI